MATNEKVIELSNRVKSIKSSSNPETNHIIAGTDDIFDDSKRKKQSTINQETDEALNDRYTKEETYSKSQLNNMVAPQHDYITVATYADLSNLSEHPIGCVYRVSNYDGTNSQVDATKYSEYSWDGTQYIHLATKSQIGEVFDVSVYNATGGTLATYDSLDALLSDDNLNTIIPEGVRHGGMRLQFVLTDVSKYVQYRLMADEWSTDTADWAIAEEGVYVENPEFIYVKTDAEDKIIWAIRTDGDIFYGAGVPSQVVNYINKKIEELSLDEYVDIVAFLNGIEEGDKTIQELFNEKVDKIEGKSLIDKNYADQMSAIENPEYLELTLDNEDKILEGRTVEGRKVIYGGVDLKGGITIEGTIDNEGTTVSVVENPEFIKVYLDKDGRILAAIKNDGDILFGCGVPSQITKYIDSLGIDTIKEDINKINNKIYENGIPDYWMTYLNSKESDIEDALENAGNHGDLFIFFSDYHLVKNTLQTPKLIKKLYDKYGKIKVISGGDILNTHATKEASMKLLEEFIESFSDVELYNVFGNHDDNPYGSSTDSHLNIDDYYPLLFKTLESNPNVSLNTNGYYYIDNRVQKIRYVILNTFGNGIGTSEPKHLEELDWFVSVLNSVEQGWYVVVVTHMFYEIHLNPGTGLHFVDKTYGLLIQAITDAYQTKQAGQYNGYTFDFQNASGNMACIITGHLHYDYSEELSTGYPVIGIIQDGILYPSAMEDNPSRETGTYTEQAFDLVSINTEDRVIKTIRFGVGDNRNFSF